MISYRNIDNEIITEKCILEDCIKDDLFGLDQSWVRITDALPISGNVTIGNNGNWFVDGEDTGFKAQGPKGDNGLPLQPRLSEDKTKIEFSYNGIDWHELFPLSLITPTIDFVEPIALEPGATPTVENVGDDFNAILQVGLPKAPEVNIGSTTTIGEGNKAKVTNSGTKYAPILNFEVPKGDTGSGLKILGFYDTFENLNLKVTAPEISDAYCVGTAEPYHLYVWTNIYNPDTQETAPGWKDAGTMNKDTTIIVNDLGDREDVAVSQKGVTDVSKNITQRIYNIKLGFFLDLQGSLNDTTRPDLGVSDYLEIIDLSRGIQLDKTIRYNNIPSIVFYDKEGNFVKAYTSGNEEYEKGDVTIPYSFFEGCKYARVNLYLDGKTTNLRLIDIDANKNINKLLGTTKLLPLGAIKEGTVINNIGKESSTSKTELFATDFLYILDKNKDIVISKAFSLNTAVPIAFYDKNLRFIQYYQPDNSFVNGSELNIGSSIFSDERICYCRATVYLGAEISNVNVVNPYSNNKYYYEQGSVGTEGNLFDTDRAFRIVGLVTGYKYRLTINRGFRIFWRVIGSSGSAITDRHGDSTNNIVNIDVSDISDGKIYFMIFNSDMSLTLNEQEFIDSNFKIEIIDSYYGISKVLSSDFSILGRNYDSQFNELDLPLLKHIIVLGQSLSTGYKTLSVLPEQQPSHKAFMYKHVRTLDFGYIFGITEEEYNSNIAIYDNDFYKKFNRLIEEGDYGNQETEWKNSHFEYESPCSGIAEGLFNAYKNEGKPELPYFVLFTCPGEGGQSITKFQKGQEIYDRVLKDVIKAKELCKGKYKYQVAYICWVQGESSVDNANNSVEWYKNQLKTLVANLNIDIKAITGQYKDINIISYQTDKSRLSGLPKLYTAIAQFELTKDIDNYICAYPIYHLPKNLTYDHLHLSNVGSRKMGNGLGYSIYLKEYDALRLFTPVFVQKSDKIITLKFDRDLIFDIESMSDTDVDTSALETTKGFFSMKDGSNIITDVTLTDSRTITITCSDNPDNLYYGYDGDLEGVVRAGAVRWDNNAIGYNNSNILMYMPIQQIL